MRGHWLKCNETAPILHNYPQIGAIVGEKQ